MRGKCSSIDTTCSFCSKSRPLSPTMSASDSPRGEGGGEGYVKSLSCKANRSMPEGAVAVYKVMGNLSVEKEIYDEKGRNRWDIGSQKQTEVAVVPSHLPP